MSNFVSGNKTRIFLNTSVGCLCKCSYCYLNSVGINGVSYKTCEDILKELRDYPEFVPGPSGSILSLGCYSECWSAKTKGETLKLLRALVQFGNYIQLATKGCFSWEELTQIDQIATFKNQIGLFISAPTISHAAEMEKGTAPIETRLSVFRCAHSLQHIYLALYIKPVLPGITDQDIDKYQALLQNNQIECVVGCMLYPSYCRNSTVHIGNSSFEENAIGQSDIIEKLSTYTRVYRHSTEVIEKYRERNGYEDSK